MSPFVVLDAGAFDILGTSRDTDMRALVRRTAEPLLCLAAGLSRAVLTRACEMLAA